MSDFSLPDPSFVAQALLPFGAVVVAVALVNVVVGLIADTSTTQDPYKDRAKWDAMERERLKQATASSGSIFDALPPLPKVPRSNVNAFVPCARAVFFSLSPCSPLLHRTASAR